MTSEAIFVSNLQCKITETLVKGLEEVGHSRSETGTTRLRGFEAAEIDSDTVDGSDQRLDVNSLKFIKRGPVFPT